MITEKKLIQLSNGRNILFEKNKSNPRYYTSDYSVEIPDAFGTKERNILVEAIHDLYLKIESLEERILLLTKNQ